MYTHPGIKINPTCIGNKATKTLDNNFKRSKEDAQVKVELLQ